jgi:hypothetical protein
MSDISLPYDWGEPIDVPKKVPRLIRVPANKALIGWVLSDRLWRLNVHFNGKRSRPCTIHTGVCDLHNTRPLRSYFLVCIWQTYEDVSVWVQVTPEALKPLQQQFANWADLLGRELEIGRIRPNMAAPVYTKLRDVYATAKKIKKVQTPEETLQRVFFPQVDGDNGLPS